MEVQRKSVGLASLASPTIFCFKVTSPDFHRTWTGQAGEFGQVRRNPLEVRRTVHWVRRNWQGPVKVRRNPSEKGGECKVHPNGINNKTWGPSTWQLIPLSAQKCGTCSSDCVKLKFERLEIITISSSFT